MEYRDRAEVHLDAENIVCVKMATKETTESIRYFEQRIKDVIEGYYRKHPSAGRLDSLVDLRGADLMALATLRPKLVGISKIGGGPRKTAVLGSRLLYILVSFVLNAAGVFHPERNVKCFTSPEEARKWLRR